MILFFLGACSHTEKIPDDTSDAVLYTRGRKALANKEYDEAVSNLKALESRYPFGPFSTHGQLYLAYVYLKNHDPQNAHAAAFRFIRLNPDHSNADYAYYIRALSSYMSNIGFIERYIPLDQSRRDTNNALKSFNEFFQLVSLYPSSPYSAEARQYMIALKDRIAQSQLHIADYYLRRRAYVAAINRGNEIVNHYPRTKAVEPALGIIIESYQHLELEKPAKAALLVLTTNFPHTALVDKQGQFIGHRLYGDTDPSIWSLATFGLLGKKKTMINNKLSSKPNEDQQHSVSPPPEASSTH